MIDQTDALVIGAGPAGSAIAILLAIAGWRVTLVEQHAFPRQKVCGECVTANSWTLLDQLGIGDECRERAGPELERVGWISKHRLVTAPFPPCIGSSHIFGRAIGRDVLDHLMLARARLMGVEIIQPAKVHGVSGESGEWLVDIRRTPRDTTVRRARLIIDAHGSWEPCLAATRRSPRSGDLFAFKARFADTALPPQLLPVLAFRGGYGGMVVSTNRTTTLACCIRRDVMIATRRQNPGISAGEAVCHYLMRACPGLSPIFEPARRLGSWLSVGPIQPGVRVDAPLGIFRVGNAAGESHPLIGEGINMALQSAFLLDTSLSKLDLNSFASSCLEDIRTGYAAAWRQAFARRLRVARAFAHIAMQPSTTSGAYMLLNVWPSLLTTGARLAGKARLGPVAVLPTRLSHEHA